MAADRALTRLLRYAVEMDPKYRLAYRFAGMALIRHTFDGKAFNVLAAEQILKQGARERPDDWQIPFNLGFIQSYYLGHMADAAASLALAARSPNAPGYLSFLSTRLAADAGNLAARGIDSGWKLLQPGTHWEATVEYRWSLVVGQ